MYMYIYSRVSVYIKTCYSYFYNLNYNVSWVFKQRLATVIS